MIGTMVWGFLIYFIFRNLKRAKTIFQVKGETYFYFVAIGIEIALIIRLIEGMFSHSLYIFFWYMIGALSIIIQKIAEKEKGSINDKWSKISATKGTRRKPRSFECR
jgi:hypothetical protein